MILLNCVIENCKKWLKKKTKNPFTGRKISPTGRIFKEYEKACDRYKTSDTELFPELWNIIGHYANRHVDTISSTQYVFAAKMTDGIWYYGWVGGWIVGDHRHGI